MTLILYKYNCKSSIKINAHVYTPLRRYEIY
nr:MAG TPA: hypothetical protein [Ackermannviridae sp.]